MSIRLCSVSPIAALLIVVCNLGVASAGADELRVAVAANFAGTAQMLIRQYEAETGHVVTQVFGSTGKHYAQILNGAPFDVFLAADVERPQMLEAQRKIVAGTRFTYAFGRIVLWSANGELVDPQGAVLEHGNFHRLAIADPKLAPYGRAAKEALVALGYWAHLKDRIVRGKNISQTFQFVSTRNAELGVIAASQVLSSENSQTGSLWVIPESLYTPIEQQAVLLRDRPVGRSFLAFLKSAAARAIIRAHGYGTS